MFQSPQAGASWLTRIIQGPLADEIEAELGVQSRLWQAETHLQHKRYARAVHASQHHTLQCARLVKSQRLGSGATPETRAVSYRQVRFVMASSCFVALPLVDTARCLVCWQLKHELAALKWGSLVMKALARHHWGPSTIPGSALESPRQRGSTWLSGGSASRAVAPREPSPSRVDYHPARTDRAGPASASHMSLGEGTGSVQRSRRGASLMPSTGTEGHVVRRRRRSQPLSRRHTRSASAGHRRSKPHPHSAASLSRASVTHRARKQSAPPSRIRTARIVSTSGQWVPDPSRRGGVVKDIRMRVVQPTFPPKNYQPMRLDTSAMQTATLGGDLLRQSDFKFQV